MKVYPQNSSGYMRIRALSDVTGLQEWVDYIPVQEVTEVAGKEFRHDDDGHIPVSTSE